MRVIVMGGSAAGLVAGLLLTRAGHGVTVLERDDLRPAADVETAAATAFRATAPHIVQPHTMLSTCRRLLREQLPDVYAALVAAGAVEAALSTQMPPTLSDRSPGRDDEDLALLMARRATVDWVLRRAAAAEPGLDVRHGVVATELVADPGAPPRIRGVRTSAGDLLADVVVDALGRRTPLDRWLAAVGARGAATSSAECGLAYYSRQYRVRPGATPPAPTTTRLVLGLDEFNVGIWGADRDTMQIALAPLAADRRFVAAREPAVFTAVLRSLPVFAAWLDALEPLTDVAVMGGLNNTLRRLVVDGAPVAVGVHAIGDAVCTTNPTFGRGLGMVLRTAVGLRDALAAHPGDREAQARALDAVIERYVAPFYADQAATDAARLAVLRHAVLGGPAPVASPEPQRVTFGELRQAARTDPVAFRGVWRLMGMVVPPCEVYEDPDVVARVRHATAAEPAAVPEQPSHRELTALLTGSPLGSLDRASSAEVGAVRAG